jgi:hypothetical protein
MCEADDLTTTQLECVCLCVISTHQECEHSKKQPNRTEQNRNEPIFSLSPHPLQTNKQTRVHVCGRVWKRTIHKPLLLLPFGAGCRAAVELGVCVVGNSHTSCEPSQAKASLLSLISQALAHAHGARAHKTSKAQYNKRHSLSVCYG